MPLPLVQQVVFPLWGNMTIPVSQQVMQPFAVPTVPVTVPLTGVSPLSVWPGMYA